VRGAVLPVQAGLGAAAVKDGRRTVQVPPAAAAYVHVFLISPTVRVRSVDELDTGAGPIIATCRTRRWAACCECGMYDLVWMAERA
jgi:hypothetical protein